MAIRGIPHAELRSGAWYYGVRCPCGQQIVIAEDSPRRDGDESLELSAPLSIECACGVVIPAQRFQKFKQA